MSDRFFLDTNILVYSKDKAFPEKMASALSLVEKGFKEGTGRISRQVLHEFYVITTQKLKPGLSRDEARMIINGLNSWKPVDLDQALTEKAWQIQDAHRLSFWDSLIIAAAFYQDCKILYSEDLTHNQVVSGITILNPFKL